MRRYILPAVLVALLLATGAYSACMKQQSEHYRTKAERVDKYCLELALTYASLRKQLEGSAGVNREKVTNDIQSVLRARYASDVIIGCIPQPLMDFGECYLRGDYDCIIGKIRAKEAEVISGLDWLD